MGPSRRAFTLIELLVSMSITSIIFLAIGSTIVIVSRSLPNPEDPTEHALSTAQVLQRLDSELRYATDINLPTQTSIEFTVADRDADASPETLLYGWSGTPGDPLTRSRNGGAPETLIEGVRGWDIAFDIFTVESDGADVEKPIVRDDVATDSFFQVTNIKWGSVVFTPALAPGATGWKITSVDLMLASDGPATGATVAQIRTADGSGRPTNTILAQTAIAESSLSSTPAVVRISFADVPEQPPDQNLCIVLFGESSLPSARVALASGTPPADDYHFASSANAGVSWSQATDTATWVNAMGIVSGVTVAVKHATRARFDLKTGNDDLDPIVASVPLHNRPEVTE